MKLTVVVFFCATVGVVIGEVGDYCSVRSHPCSCPSYGFPVCISNVCHCMLEEDLGKRQHIVCGSDADCAQEKCPNKETPECHHNHHHCTYPDGNN